MAYRAIARGPTAPNVLVSLPDKSNKHQISIYKLAYHIFTHLSHRFKHMRHMVKIYPTEESGTNYPVTDQPVAVYQQPSDDDNN